MGTKLPQMKDVILTKTKRGLVAKPRKLPPNESSEYIARAASTFRQGSEQGGCPGALSQLEGVYHAKVWLKSNYFGQLCAQVGLDPKSPEVDMMCAIGEKVQLASTRIEEWEAFSLMFAVTMIAGIEFDCFVEWGHSAAGMGSDEIRQGVVGEMLAGRPAFSSAIKSPLPFPRKWKDT